ncbi:type II secretory pathway, component PulD [Synoicihabitans lomoniglobus]|uniref:Type II secretory pathway, component PulD n=1 Tax=Synoicihabitans lomoniglobus TaxID=2909285 RepID=A0AAF0CRI7_9BACT|nr:type II secretory pathway, component PulD [Opitutaceae bacterium LMO-M01]WED66651.1 type II secretory pathway, component PulD [Opitutaceae bacterium LMO-M01]
MFHLTRLSRFLCFTTGFIAAGLLTPTESVQAQSTTETKIRLMADALRARDDGDLEAAERNLLELTELAPTDPAVKRLLMSVQQDLAAERQRFDITPAPVATSSAPPADSLTRASSAAEPGPNRLPPSTPEPEVAAIAKMEAEIAALAAAEETRQRQLIDAARTQGRDARTLQEQGRFEAALATLDTAMMSMPENPLTLPVIKELADQRDQTRRAQAEALSAARTAVVRPREVPPVQTSAPIVTVATAPAPSRSEALWAEARADYAAGRYGSAQDTVDELLAYEPGHRGAARLAARITEERATSAANWRGDARQSLIEEVGLAWRRPELASEPSSESHQGAGGVNPLQQKLHSIRIPSVSFSSVELHRVVSTLSDLSREFDPAGDGRGGINIIVIDPQDRRPNVSLTLRDLSLKRVLDFITDSIGYQYEVQADAIVVRPGGETSTLDTEFFPITRSTVIRMTGIGGGLASGGAVVANDPFSPAPVSGPNAPGGGSEAAALQMFLQQAGVDFEGIAGASLAYDGSAMIVTQTSRNVERIRNILNRYNDVRQVEIEAKFMEVQEGALEELGIQWSVTHGVRGDPRYLATGDTQNRSLSDAFTNTVAGTTGRIFRPAQGELRDTDGNITQAATDELSIPIVNSPATLPQAVDLAANAGSLANIQGLIGEFDVNAVVRALSRQQGSDLLSAPKVTVLSGNPATITVAQELRYPTSYGEVRSEVGSSSRESSSAGVTITAGTPQDFETRKVGVELRVTPTVEEDDYSISLDLNPKVTEFEGFVEYGGQSVAISNNTTVTVPSGFYQPIFSTREVSTKVTLWDGSTLVMGGLTREEVKTVHDKVPFLGDIPGLGRLFRSTGETTQKRNLLIFVTANLVSPGGSPKKQIVTGVPPSSTYQNQSIVTPEGPAARN